METLDAFAKRHLPLVEKEMVDFLTMYTNDDKLKNSMLYSIQAGGKRIRPLLLLVSYASFGEQPDTGCYQTAASLEMVHTYSLIHDDLPAMDNDDLRRGKPTNHKVFNEAIAILAGDGLLTAAFQFLSMANISLTPKLLLIQQLAMAGGTNGMVAGQAADIEGEHKQLTLEELVSIHERKTGKLIEFALVASGILAEQSESILESLQDLARHLGLAFQIRDDLLDITKTSAELGKTAGKDIMAEKSTYPQLLGLDEAKRALAHEISAAKKIVSQLKEIVPHYQDQTMLEVIQLFEL